MTDLSKQPVLMQAFQPCCYEAAVCAYMEYLTFKAAAPAPAPISSPRLYITKAKVYMNKAKMSVI